LSLMTLHSHTQSGNRQMLLGNGCDLLRYNWEDRNGLPVY
jgi:hypothetical protein